MGQSVKSAALLAFAVLASVASSQSTQFNATSTGTATVSSSATQTEEHNHTEATGYISCHLHNNELWCTHADGDEVQVQYTECHDHDGATYCGTADGQEVEVTEEGADTTTSGEHCHFHAGVEHCSGDSSAQGDTTTQCIVNERLYNKKLRIGALFIVLCTSSIAVFAPIILSKFTGLKFTGLAFTVIKQFGTGVIIATAYIHLLTHAQLMFNNPCMGELQYEATTTAISMAGIFLSFFIEYVGGCMVQSRAAKAQAVSPEHDAGSGGEEEATAAKGRILAHGHGHSHGAELIGVDDHVGVIVMEAGIVFHSVLIGTTLVVAGDSVFSTLLVVIIFHQMFEGLALGARISQLKQCSLITKFLMAAAFSVTTPLGMGIGVGVLNKFNGNDRQTLIAMGTLDALSAGILAWVGLAEMLAADWLHGDLKTSGPLKTFVGMVSLVGGMAMMGLLGKWA